MHSSLTRLALLALVAYTGGPLACTGDPQDGSLTPQGDVTFADVAVDQVGVSVILMPAKERYTLGEAVDVRCQLDASPLPADVEQLSASLWLDGQWEDEVRLNEVGAAWFDLVAPSVGGDHTVECSVNLVDDSRVVGHGRLRVNYPPEVGALAIAPATPTASDTLTYAWDAAPSDQDGDVLATTQRWFAAGELAPDGTGPIVPPSAVRKGQAWEVEVTVDDGFVQVTRRGGPVTIVNTPPSVGAVHISPTFATSGTALRCVASDVVDADADEVALSYAWFEAASAAPSVASDSDLLPGDAVHAGQQWRCVVTPADDETAGQAVESAPVEVLNRSPRAPTEVRLSPEAGTADTAFTCLFVEPAEPDTDGDPVSPVYTWRVGGVALPGGEGQANFTPSAFGRGDALSCCVALTDGSAPSAATCSAPSILQDRAPLVGTVAITPVDPDERSTLACVPAGFTDPDGDALTYAESWTVNGSPVEGASDGSLTGAAFDEGDAVSCALTVSDGELAAGPVEAKAPVVIGNAAPMVVAVTVAPAAAHNGESVSCSASVDEPDAGDAVTIGYTWVADDGATLGAGATLAVAGRAVATTIRCVATANDGTESSAPVDSAAVPVVNTTPALTEAPVLGPTPLSSTDDAVCTAGVVTDPDPQATSVRIAWLRNGALVPGADSAMLGAGSFVRGDVLQCEATPTDGLVDGAPRKSGVVHVTNSPPAATAVVLDPANGTSGTLFTCSAEGEDADGDDVFFSWGWYVNGERVAGQSAAQAYGLVSQIGDVLTCEATPWDDDGAGTPRRSNEASFANSPPTLAGAQLGPAEAWVGTTLVCQALGFLDPEGAAPAYAYEWLVNGVVLPQAAGAQLAGAFQHYDSVQCRVRPYDGIAHGTPRVSNAVVVKNSAPTAPVVTFTPGSPSPGEPLGCVIAQAAGDPDGDAVTLSYRWEIDGAAVAGHTAASLPAGQTALCQEVVCEVTPSDGLPGGVGPSGAATAIVSAPEVCDGVDSDCDGETDEGLSCGRRVDVVFDLPPGVSGAALAGPLAGLVTEDRSTPDRLDLTLEGVQDGLLRLPIQWMGAGGGLRRTCELLPSGSPWLPSGLPRVSQDGSPVAVTLRRFDDGSGCAAAVDIGAHALPAVWWEGPSQLAISGATVDAQAYPCAVFIGGHSGWWSGPVLRRGSDSNLHLDARPWGGLPAGSYQFAVYGIEGPCPDEDFHVLTPDPLDTLESYPYWIVDAANMSAVGKAWFFPTAQGNGARFTSDGRGNVLPAGGYVAGGEPLPPVVSDTLCVDGALHVCEAHEVPGESLCAGGVWLRCTAQSTANPPEVLGDGVDNDGDGFVDEGAGNLVQNPRFEAGLDGWFVNDSVPFWGTAGSDGVGNGTLKLSGGAVGAKAGELNLIQANTVPAAQIWHLQLQTPTPMVAGQTYVLTYRTWASTRVRTALEVSDPNLDYRSVGLYVGAPDHYLWAGPRWITRRVIFTATRTVPDAILTFSAGLDPGTLVLDDVSLEILIGP